MRFGYQFCLIGGTVLEVQYWHVICTYAVVTYNFVIKCVLWSLNFLQFVFFAKFESHSYIRRAFYCGINVI